jgi:Xaa-Pro dipeptidase
LFKGIPTVHRNYDDIDEVVDQESTFWYLFGVKEADCYALIENGSGKTTIFVPRLPESLKMWMTIKPNEEFKKGSEADQVLYSDEF